MPVRASRGWLRRSMVAQKPLGTPRFSELARRRRRRIRGSSGDIGFSLLGALALSCTSRSGPLEGPAASAAPSTSVPVPVVRPVAVDRGSRAKVRAACGFVAGARPSETLDSDTPIGESIPVDHFVVVMQENRSFDHYFQKLPEYGQPNVEVAPPSYDNADPSGEGEIVHPYLLTDPCVKDVPHNWVAVHHQIGEGKMSGFLAAANPEGRRALGYYDDKTLPYYYALASTFALADHYFAAVPGPTFPNRMFFLSASSFGHAVNTPPPPRDEERTLFHQLERKGLSWVVYAEGPTFEEKMYPRLHAEKGEHFRTIREYYEDATAGRLPFFAWVESSFGGAEATDEHAPADVQVGQAFVARVIHGLSTSPQWPRSILFLMYDEHGGFFDHVPPPAACPPDAERPRIDGIHAGSQFDRLGVRVPFIAVSPFARRHYVSHKTYSHTSVLRFVQARADLPALGGRDANADPPFDLFDFSHPEFLEPPALPEATIDEAARRKCLEVAPREKPSLEHPTDGVRAHP
jgi:phospholipase C